MWYAGIVLMVTVFSTRQRSSDRKFERIFTGVSISHFTLPTLLAPAAEDGVLYMTFEVSLL